MSNDRFSRVRAFAGPNALEPSRNPAGPSGSRVVGGYVASTATGVVGGQYTVSPTGPLPGTCVLNFNPPFYNPVAVVSPVTGPNWSVYSTRGPRPSQITVNTQLSGAGATGAFNFLVTEA